MPALPGRDTRETNKAANVSPTLAACELNSEPPPGAPITSFRSLRDRRRSHPDSHLGDAVGAIEAASSDYNPQHHVFPAALLLSMTHPKTPCTDSVQTTLAV